LNPGIKTLCDRLWFDYFKKPLDTLGNDWAKVLLSLRKYFFACAWFEVYDFVEFVANNFPYSGREELIRRGEFLQACNVALEKEVSAYRFVNGLIARITDQAEVAEIDRALERARGPVRTHLRRALELLSDREFPDYRNSIKESISAVESLVATLVGEKGTLGQLIKKLEDEIGLHPALRTAFGNLYGYTSDEGGIRHAILESKDLAFEDAKFFLVVCSGFVNFVESKVAASG
jgi:AbiJ N-terminal domain 4